MPFKNLGNTIWGICYALGCEARDWVETAFCPHRNVTGYSARKLHEGEWKSTRYVKCADCGRSWNEESYETVH